MAVEVGSIIEGKVTAIKPFGMFVSISDNQQGLVHISQVANEFVKDINDHFSVGDTVKVKVLSIDDAGKISLSVRAALPPEQRSDRRGGGRRESNASFEEKLKKWLKHSEENLASINKKYNKRG